MTRLDLEQQLMDCWHIVDDLDVIFAYVCETDREDLDQDRIANMILGLGQLYDLKHQKTFATFEKLLKEIDSPK